ncbi:MAG: TIGR01777 family protein [Ponticaulis sp.]|nr:TIGR01777 family protein [Ponticaulis sp.]
MSLTLWCLISVQIILGGFDTLFHHEFTERLPWRHGQAKELKLHSIRCFIYAIVFALIGVTEPKGLFAGTLLVLMLVEIGITLTDFVEEDLTRKLPASERVLHTLLAINFGAILAFFAPVLWHWSTEPTGLASAPHGPVWSGVMIACAVGVAGFGLRDWLASERQKKLPEKSAIGLLASELEAKNILITGGTGFIGRRLVEALNAVGADVTVLTRNPANAASLTHPVRVITSLDQIRSDTPLFAIVNLAGEPIVGGLWTKRFRQKLLTSRTQMTSDLVELVKRLETRPEVVVSGSAIGVYGANLKRPVCDNSVVRDDGSFSQKLCQAWEAEASRFSEQGIRTVLLRTGIVLDTSGGTLGQMLFPFEYGIGGPFGSGRQIMSWITRDDLVRLIGHALDKTAVRGPLNGVTPKPVTNRAFSQTLGKVLHRPSFLPIPGPVLRTGLGDLAREIFLANQDVRPAKALETGFRFQHTSLENALTDMIRVCPSDQNQVRAQTDRISTSQHT